MPNNSENPEKVPLSLTGEAFLIMDEFFEKYPEQKTKNSFEYSAFIESLDDSEECKNYKAALFHIKKMTRLKNAIFAD